MTDVYRAPTRRRVNVFLAGVQKSGTTSMFRYLRQHPQINAARRPFHAPFVGDVYMPFSGLWQRVPEQRVANRIFLKEVHYFDDDRFDWNRPDYAALERRYSARPGSGLDCSPSYILHADYLQRIRDYNPKARVLLIFREPIERAFSHWRMRRHLGREQLDFESALRAEDERIMLHSAAADRGRDFAYVRRGRYASQLRTALTIFPREQFHLIDFSDLVEDHAAVLDRTAQFLQIRRFRTTEPIRANEGRRPADGPSASARSFIRDALGAEMVEFEELSGIRFNGWAR